MRVYITILYSLICFISSAQTLGGSAAYNFLRLPSSTLLTASGGINASYRTNDVGLTANNPALLNVSLHGQISCSFSKLPDQINTYALTGAYQYSNLNTTLAGHIFFADYGTTAQTDAAGNRNGSFRPIDIVIQLEAARKYEKKWSYGLSLKFINSDYQLYKSSSIATDVSVLYVDSSTGLSASVLAKNMGFQLKSYAGEKEDVPFDLQVGITKRLKNAPFGFSATAHHVHQFDLTYNDEVYNQSNNISSNSAFGTKLLNHLVLASHIYIGYHLEGTIGYNYLRRNELNVGAAGNGLSGFSIGVRVKFQKLQIMYARANYLQNIALNQLGINLNIYSLSQ